MSDLKQVIRDIPDFPEKGILFRDITPLLNDPDAFEEVIDRLTEETEGLAVDRVVGIESRGFIFGTPLAMRLGVGFVPVRKPGKLPAEVEREEYTLEYGTAAIEIHKDAIQPGENVLILDDLLATGGTAAAACNLVERLGGKVSGCAFVIELDFLNGREKLPGHNIVSLIRY
jgi:adenine phosphoribosyltransferase